MSLDLDDLFDFVQDEISTEQHLAEKRALLAALHVVAVVSDGVFGIECGERIQFAMRDFNEALAGTEKL